MSYDLYVVRRDIPENFWDYGYDPFSLDANHRPRLSSRDTVDLSRPILSAVRRMLRCCSQCSFSIRILSSDDRCEYC